MASQTAVSCCNICKSAVKETDEAVSCDICEVWTHRRCVSDEIDRRLYRRMVRGEVECVFKCLQCKHDL